MRAQRNTASRADGAAARHPRPLVWLHWLTALCLVLAAAFILTRDQMDGRAMRMWLLEGHRHLGLFVLGLFFIRVAVRFRVGRLPPETGESWLMRAAAGITHVALYALLLAQPLLGWALTSASGKTVDLFGIALPPLVAEDEDLADALHMWHLDAAWALLALVCLHAGAALWHHFIRRDGVLRRMSPRRPR
ncbi:MAG: cytochrome b [Luteibacter sp.]|jgi:cytochrome b561